MNINLLNQKNYLSYSILVIYLSNTIDIISGLFELNFPLLRYLLLLLSFVFYLKGINQFKINRKLTPPVTVFIFQLFLFWSFFMFFMSIDKIISSNNNYINFKNIISGTLLLYTIPFVIFCDPNVLFIRNLFQLSYKLSILLLIFTIPLVGYFTSSTVFEGYGVFLGGGSSILILTHFYHSRKVKWISFSTILIIIFINALNTRRNVVLYFSSILFFTGLITLFSESPYVKKKRLLSILKGLFFFIFLSSIIFFNATKFNPFVERIQTGGESRQDYIDEFYEDFNKNPVDWITGRGVFGEFESSLWSKTENDDTRPGIENGYLDHILRGGIIYLVLLILISLPAIYLGFFKSNNILCKGFAAIILINFIDLYGFGIPSLTLKYIFIWIGATVCYSKRMRSLSDVYLQKAIGI